MIYDVRHLTTVDYSSPVRLARFNVRLVPAPWRGQLLHSVAPAVQHSHDPDAAVNNAVKNAPGFVADLTKQGDALLEQFSRVGLI